MALFLPIRPLAGPVGDWECADLTGYDGGRLDSDYASKVLRDGRTRALPFFELLSDSIPVSSSFIFHVSHCGSTLLSRIVGSLPSSISCNEPAFVSSVCASYYEGRIDFATFARALRGFLGTLEEAAPGKRVVVKPNSAACTMVAEIGRAVGASPAVFLLRDPSEVLVALRDREMGRFNPFALLLGQASPGELAQLSWNEAMARVMLRNYIAADQVKSDLCRPFGYPNWCSTEGVVEILRQLKIVASPTESSEIEGWLGRDAKSPDKEFVADGDDKRDSASPDQATALAQVAEVYVRLLNLE